MVPAQSMDFARDEVFDDTHASMRSRIRRSYDDRKTPPIFLTGALLQHFNPLIYPRAPMSSRRRRDGWQ
jgi:hypothetical protein